jgi:hypothetical protein
MRVRTALILLAVILVAMLAWRLWAVAAVSLVLVHANGRMIRRRWLSEQPPLASGESRGRLLGELGAAGVAGWLIARRHGRRELERELRMAELSRDYEPLLPTDPGKDW